MSVPISMTKGKGVPAFEVQLTSITLNDSTTAFQMSSSAVVPFILGSRTIDLEAPAPIVQEIHKLTCAVMGSKSPSFGYVSYNLSAAAASIIFGFGGLKGISLTISMSVIVMSYNRTLEFPEGSAACAIGAQASPTSILGDNFLRPTNVVFSIDTKQVGLAQAKPNATAGSSIVEIEIKVSLAP